MIKTVKLFTNIIPQQQTVSDYNKNNINEVLSCVTTDSTPLLYIFKRSFVLYNKNATQSKIKMYIFLWRVWDFDLSGNICFLTFPIVRVGKALQTHDWRGFIHRYSFKLSPSLKRNESSWLKNGCVSAIDKICPMEGRSKIYNVTRKEWSELKWLLLKYTLGACVIP